MDRGTYIAASAGLLQFRRLEIVSNNLANVNTVGFKKQILTGDVQSFEDTFAREVQAQDPFARPDHERSPGVVNIRAATDFSVGSIRETGNPLDVAARDSRDFFVVTTPNGAEYTRGGNFTLGADGQLVSQDGYPVQGDGGAIAIDGGTPTIAADGSVRVNGATVGRLRMVRFEDTAQLEPTGGQRFKVRGNAAPADVEASVVPGALEMANVNVIRGMVDLISANRAFSMYTKSAETIDQMNQSAINTYGRRPR